MNSNNNEPSEPRNIAGVNFSSFLLWAFKSVPKTKEKKTFSLQEEVVLSVLYINEGQGTTLTNKVYH